MTNPTMLKNQSHSDHINPSGPIRPISNPDTMNATYFYAPRGRGFRIYRRESRFSAIPMPDEPLYLNREDAQRRVYQLNGWNLDKRKMEKSITHDSQSSHEAH